MNHHDKYGLLIVTPNLVTRGVCEVKARLLRLNAAHCQPVANAPIRFEIGLSHRVIATGMTDMEGRAGVTCFMPLQDSPRTRMPVKAVFPGGPVNGISLRPSVGHGQLSLR